MIQIKYCLHRKLLIHNHVQILFINKTIYKWIYIFKKKDINVCLSDCNIKLIEIPIHSGKYYYVSSFSIIYPYRFSATLYDIAIQNVLEHEDIYWILIFYMITGEVIIM